MTLEDAKLFLKVEDDTDDVQVQNSLDSAIAYVNSYLYPKAYGSTDTDTKLTDDESKIAAKGIEYSLHHFYYNRDGMNNKDFEINLKYILQPIRTLKV